MPTLKTELHNKGLCKQANRNKQERSSHVGVSEPLLLMYFICWVFLSCPPFSVSLNAAGLNQTGSVEGFSPLTGSFSLYL